MKLYIDNKIFEGTPEEILKVIDLMEGKKAIEQKITIKPEITSPSIGSPWKHPNTIISSGICSMHNQVCCPICK
jgi:hypothetical protein